MELVTVKQKTDKLREAIALLMDADACIQSALGATDSCYDTHCGIEEIIDDLRADIEDLEVRGDE